MRVSERSTPVLATRPKRFGRYLLLERVAIGGMAEIFLAAEEQGFAGHRFVTVKRIRPDFDEPEYREFFITEARVSLQCSHPNVPQTFEVGEIDGTPFLSMEYIHGHTLLSYLKAISRHRGTGSTSIAVTVGSALAAALEHVHALRSPSGSLLDVIHRDVTPQNVLVSTVGAVKLIDFGIVRSAIQIHQTKAGVVKGKFSYMAPETLDDPGSVDHRADLFAVGIMLYEILTGRPLFRGRSEGETMERVRHLPVPPLAKVRPDIPAELDALVMRALARDPAERFQTATELLTAIDGVATRNAIPLSNVGLRSALTEACGEPPMPVFDGDRYSIADAGPRRRAAAGSDSEVSAARGTTPPPVRPAVSPTLAAADSELGYYLERAGIDTAFVAGDVRRDD